MFNLEDSDKIIHYLSSLNLEKDKIVTITDIKNSYRKLSKIYHPDVCSIAFKDGKKFMEIKEAYDYLINNFSDVNECILLFIKVKEDPSYLDTLKKQKSEEKVILTEQERHFKVVRDEIVNKFENYIMSLNARLYNKKDIITINNFETEFINKIYSDNCITPSDLERTYAKYIDKIHSIKQIKEKNKFEIKHPFLFICLISILIACILIIIIGFVG